MQRILNSSGPRRETVDIGILIVPSYGNRKIIQPSRIKIGNRSANSDEYLPK